MKTDYIKDWEESTNRLMGAFVKKYFTFADVYWIGEQTGGILSVNDRFFSMEDIYLALKNKTKQDILFKEYDSRLEKYEKMH